MHPFRDELPKQKHDAYPLQPSIYQLGLSMAAKVRVAAAKCGDAGVLHALLGDGRWPEATTRPGLWNG